MPKVAEYSETVNVKEYLKDFVFNDGALVPDFFETGSKTKQEYLILDNRKIPKYINEFWTAKQCQANSIHEISYRACFKPQLPRFFIELFTKEQDIVYDPFSGRGTTILEAALLNRNIIANDINPLSAILSKPRLYPPDLSELKKRLDEIKIIEELKSEIDLSMFYHSKTLTELLSIRNYLNNRRNSSEEDELDSWIRMVATNRLTGHSKGFFSVYTLPPNQAITPENQKKINEKRSQKPEYRNTKEIILTKSVDLLRDVTKEQRTFLRGIANNALFISKDARHTSEINKNSVQLTVTSPPFLDIVQYSDDNWLRSWFNNINVDEISKKITMSKKIDDWCEVMNEVFRELYRITMKQGYIAFEVGEVRNGKIKLDEYVLEIGINAGFSCECIMINQQIFTKTANIWGVKNNESGTNSNRIVIFKKK